MWRLRGFRLFLTGIGATLLLLGLAPAAASSANISHSYHATDQIIDGSIVCLDASRSDYVVPANTNNGARLLGVAVASNDSLLAVDPSDTLTQVATSGVANVLVSTINGSVKVGDQIAVSPFNGIGMKSVPGAHIIGLTQTAFDGTSSNAVSEQVTDRNGKQTEIKVGLVRVSIAIGTDTSNTGGNQYTALQRFAKAITGHNVSTVRVVLSIIIAIVALGSLVVLVYASIYGSIISIGRNPLAKFAVFRTLGSVLGMAALTALVASLIIFFLLR